MRKLTSVCLAVLTILSAASHTLAQSNATSSKLAPFVETLRKVQPEGVGHREASTAWGRLVQSADANSLPTILEGMDGASPLAENWLRAAVDAVAERYVQQTGTLPVDRLEAFLTQTAHNPKARRLAYEWLARVDQNASDRLIPNMANDPSPELRRDAVSRLLVVAETTRKANQREDAIAAYRKVLDFARDLDQVKTITEALTELGAPVDLAHHYGFIVDWQVIGPFDNRGGKGFRTVYPPEETVDLAANYEGVAGNVNWKPYQTDHEYGEVDLNKALGKHMGVAGYALAVFESPSEQPVELRLGSENAIQIWLNGEKLCEAEAYHANSAIDQYIGRGVLKPGKNLILVKACQDERTVDWAQSWSFQLRACDSSGKAILSQDRPAAKPTQKKADATASADAP